MAKWYVSEQLKAFEEKVGTPEFKAKLAADNIHKVLYLELHEKGNQDPKKLLSNSESVQGILIKAAKVPNIDNCEIRVWKSQLKSEPKVAGKAPDFVIACDDHGSWNDPKPKAEKPAATEATEAAEIPQA
jgi:hypothetical protein